nr:zinc finger, RING/FYVE/PHD-type, acyl-CoA N-acyltransferase, Jas TPL-binding domain protein [Tanacetum cinerariifolium]
MKALDVMQECFNPVKHPLSDEDMIEDVIFGRATKRSNFKGFYTAVLEENDEIITVVTLRVHGYKVAEIPFVATKFSHRRLGMCRILMDEVERMIRGLGVERIMLPACTDTTNTWLCFLKATEIKQSTKGVPKCPTNVVMLLEVVQKELGVGFLYPSNPTLDKDRKHSPRLITTPLSPYLQGVMLIFFVSFEFYRIVRKGLQGNMMPTLSDTNNITLKKKRGPVIYHATRTHSHISQVIVEFRKTNYHVPVAVLSSTIVRYKEGGDQ